MLDEAISQLGPEDRAAILPRFSSRGLPDGGVPWAAMKTPPTTRGRALDRNCASLTRRGVLSVTALGTALASQAVRAPMDWQQAFPALRWPARRPVVEQH
jgi:hypothetical protein